MPDHARSRPMVALGVIGIAAILLSSLAYALWRSGEHYESVRIQQKVGTEIQSK